MTTTRNPITRRYQKLASAGRTMKQKLRSLEQDWWDEKMKGFKNASTKRGFGNVYSLLPNLRTSSKPEAVTSITADPVKNYFAKISSIRFGVNPTDMEEAIVETLDRRGEVPLQRAKQLNTTPIEEAMSAMNETKILSPRNTRYECDTLEKHA